MWRLYHVTGASGAPIGPCHVTPPFMELRRKVCVLFTYLSDLTILTFTKLRILVINGHCASSWWSNPVMCRRYVVVAGSVTQLEALVTTRNGKKTENILGVVKIASDTWRLYTNQLYWSPGVKTIATYSRSGFHVQQPNLFPEKVGNLRGAALKVMGATLLFL
ncbi:uncharacterized protein LOC135103296 [Scylla paramamosain]|uniref:uncharacterized protein LOC135103296 n=1 Tax=Scylla paramamosain TaxID=85552 RepID=UPI003082C65A